MQVQKRSVFDRIDDAIYAVEKGIVALFFSVMTLVVFFDVTHRIFIAPESQFGALWLAFEEGSGLAWLAPAPLLLFGVFVFYAGLRERWGKDSSRKKALGGSVIGVVAFAVLLKVFLWMFPNGLIWSQTLGLSLMLWVGLIGASMAAKQRRHLALEFGKKIWPQSMKMPVQIFAGVLVAAFCAFLAYLAWGLIVDEYEFYDPVYRTGMFTGLPLPKFLVYAILPYGFFMIVFRFFRGSLKDGDLTEADLILKQKKEMDEKEGAK